MIPIIDLEPMFSGSSEGLREVGAKLFEVYSKCGFGLVKNHRVPQGLLDSLIDACREFHDLPEAEKLEIKHDNYFRGFLPMNIATFVTSKLATVTKANQNDSFVMLNEIHPDQKELMAESCLGGENKWPRSLPNFKKVVMSYYNSQQQLAGRLLHAFAVGLGLPENYFDRFYDKPVMCLRLLHYPPMRADGPKDLFGFAPHTDHGVITTLLQDDVGGLQAKTPDGDWVDVVPEPGTIVVNTGDMMVRWSNRKLRSTPHRVRNTSGQPRYSLPFFFNCSYEAQIQPIASLIAEGEEVHFEPVIFGEYIEELMRTNYHTFRRP